MVEHADVGMADHPVVVVSDALHMRQGHHGALDIDEEIEDGAGEYELGADIGMDVAEFAFHCVPYIDQKNHDRNDHGNAVHDRYCFQPGRHRRLQQMMGADVGIYHDQRPEAQQRQRVAV